MTPAAARYRPALVAVAAFVWLAMLAWPRPLMLPDEGRYAGVAWEMLRSGDWLVPTLNGLPYFHKPPLFYWITAASMAVFGPVEWAARAAPLLGAWVAVMATTAFVVRWWGRPAALRTLLVLLTLPLLYIGGQFANLDMLVAGCITATIVLLAHAALQAERGRPRRAVLAGAWAAAACGVLAKGLIGLVLPVLVIGTWLLLRRRWRSFGALLWWPGIVLFAALALPWFVAMQRHFPEFLHYFFVVQHFQRYAAAGFNNVEPWWFFPVVLLGAALPWWPWLAARGWRARWFGSEGDGRAELRLLMLLWIVIVVGFFSLPQSKLLGYVLPAVPPLAVLVGDAIGGVVGGAAAQAPSRRWLLAVGFMAVLDLSVVAVLAVRTPHSAKLLAAPLRGQPQADAPLLMLGHYYFDLPLYGRLRQPAAVVLDWADPDIPRRDSWRKELADAAGFAPERAHALLLQPARIGTALCARRVSWVIGPAGSEQTYAFLRAAQVDSRNAESTLWRVDRARPELNALLGCDETPTAG